MVFHLGLDKLIIVYPCSGVNPSTVHNFKINIFSKTAWPIKAKFCEEPPWVGGIISLRHLGHMTNLASMPIYGKNPQNFSPEPVD